MKRNVRPARITLCCLVIVLAQCIAAQNIPYFTPLNSHLSEVEPTIPPNTVLVRFSKAMSKTYQATDSLKDEAAVLYELFQSAQSKVNELSLSIPANSAMAKQARLDSISVVGQRADSLLRLYKLRLDSALAIVAETENLNKQAERVRVAAEEKREDAAQEAQKSIPDIMKSYRSSKTAARTWFNSEVMAKTKDIKVASTVAAERDTIMGLLTDSLSDLRHLKDERVRLFHAMKGSTGLMIVNGNSDRTEEFYNPFDQQDSKFLQSNILTLNTETGHGALYSEIFHDYIGPIRIGFGGLLSNAAKEDDGDTTAVDPETIKEDQAQRVLGGGGNLVSTFALPLIGFTSPNGTFMFRFSFQPKLSLDLSNYKQDSTSVPFHSDLGFELHTSLSGAEGQLSFFGSVRPSILVGNPSFYDNLQKGNLRSIALAQVRFGMGIGNALRVSYSVNAGDIFVQGTFPSQLTVTLLTAGLSGK